MADRINKEDRSWNLNSRGRLESPPFMVTLCPLRKFISSNKLTPKLSEVTKLTKKATTRTQTSSLRKGETLN